MSRFAAALILSAALAAALAPLGAQPAGEPAVAGARLGPVPEVLYAHLPGLTRGQGAVVEEVQAGSALDRAGLRKHDVLIAYGGTPIRDARHFARMAGQAKAGEQSALVLLRGGKQATLLVDLAAGAESEQHLVKGVLKAGGPPAVTVEARPLQQGKLRVTFTYYSDGSGKLEQVTCDGSLGEIEAEVRSLGEQNRISPRLQDLIDVALKRIRAINVTP